MIYCFVASCYLGPVAWEFEHGLEGFANSTTESLSAETYAHSGEFYMQFRGSDPAFDSPLFEFTLYDDAYIVLRMNYHGRGTTTKFWLREEVFPPAEYRTGDAVWRDGEYFERSVEIIGDGRFHVYYIPLFDQRNPTPQPQITITQLRFFPATPARAGESAIVDWIRIMKGTKVGNWQCGLDGLCDCFAAGFFFLASSHHSKGRRVLRSPAGERRPRSIP